MSSIDNQVRCHAKKINNAVRISELLRTQTSMYKNSKCHHWYKPITTWNNPLTNFKYTLKTSRTFFQCEGISPIDTRKVEGRKELAKQWKKAWNMYLHFAGGKKAWIVLIVKMAYCSSMSLFPKRTQNKASSWLIFFHWTVQPIPRSPMEQDEKRL